MGPLWLQIVTGIFGVIGTLYRYLREFLGGYSVIIPDISMLVFWVVLLCFVVWRLLSYATAVRKSLDPKFDFIVSPRPDHIRVDRGEKFSIRGQVTGLIGKNTYTASIDSVRKHDAATSTYGDNTVRSSIDLYWPDTKKDTMVKAETSVTIAQGQHHIFDIVEAHSSNGLRVPGSEGTSWTQLLFSETGKYEVKVRVTSGDAFISKTLEINWPGTWDHLTFEEK